MVIMSTTKSRWTASLGTMTFLVPGTRPRHVEARTIDRPNTVCDVIDAMRRLSRLERRLIVSLLDELEKEGRP